VADADQAAPGNALAIVGATATGKSDIAVEVARRIHGEIVSVDSRQVYRGMDIGTAKPDLADRGGVTHHGFDLVDPDQRFNAGRFAGWARRSLADIAARGHVPVLAGGTGFYLRALTHPMFDEPPMDGAASERWKRFLAGLGTDELRRWAAARGLRGADARADRQRLARLIEIVVLTGRPLHWWHEHAESAQPAIDLPVFVLELPRDVLYERINRRVDRMVEAGLVDEVAGLVAQGYDESVPGMNATGYIELIPHIRGERGLDEAVDMIRRASRRFARRQVTWFRHQVPAGTVYLPADRPAAEVAADIIDVWREGRA
jgi:tRNA dimethylallyltransferase